MSAGTVSHRERDHQHRRTRTGFVLPRRPNPTRQGRNPCGGFLESDDGEGAFGPPAISSARFERLRRLAWCQVCDQPSDDELMQRGAEGDADALGILVQRWERRVFGFLDRMLGSREEAQDVAQEAFLRMCGQVRKYRPTGCFRSWLFRIAGNLARSRLRRRKILRWVRFDPATHERPDREERPDQPLLKEEERIAVRRALGRLPARQRQAVVLRQYQGLAYREIAEAMETSVSAVETLLFRGMKALRADFAGRESRP